MLAAPGKIRTQECRAARGCLVFLQPGAGCLAFFSFSIFSLSFHTPRCQKRECTPFGVHPFWLLFISRVVAWEEVEGIDGCAVDSDFVVAVRAGAVSGAAHDGDDAALVDVLAYGDENGGVMAISCDEAAGVLDFDEVAVAAYPACLGDGAGCCGFDWEAVVACDVDAFMVGRAYAASGAGTVAKVAGDLAFDGPDIRCGGISIEELDLHAVGLVHEFFS